MCALPGILSDAWNTLGATSFPCTAVDQAIVLSELEDGNVNGLLGIDEGRAMVRDMLLMAPVYLSAAYRLCSFLMTSVDGALGLDQSLL